MFIKHVTVYLDLQKSFFVFMFSEQDYFQPFV